MLASAWHPSFSSLRGRGATHWHTAPGPRAQLGCGPGCLAGVRGRAVVLTSQEGTALGPGHQQAHLGAGPSAQVGSGSSDPHPALPPAGQDHGPSVELPALKQELVHPPQSLPSTHPPHSQMGTEATSEPFPSRSSTFSPATTRPPGWTAPSW